MSRSTNMPSKSSGQDNEMDGLTPAAPYIATSSPWTAESTGDRLTSCSGDSPVNPTQSRETGPVQPMKEIYGRISSELLGTWDPASCTWKTCQLSILFQGTDGQHLAAPWLDNWPNSGMVLNGMLYRRPTPGRPIFGNVGGLWPTPCARDHKDVGENTNYEALAKKGKLSGAVNWPTPTSKEQCGSVEKWGERRAAARLEHNNGNGFGMPLDIAVQQWPTPRVSDTEGGIVQNVEYENGSFSRVNADGVRWGVKLKDAVDHVEKHHWPTPTATERSGINPNTGNGAGLSKVIKQWPTPTASEGSKIPSRPNYGQVGLSNHPDIVGTPDRPKMAKNRKGIRQNKWSTPTARDHKDGTAESCSNVPENGLLGRTIHEGQNQPNAALNPDWVEWLMGVPIGWSSPDPLPEGAWEEWITDITSGTWWDTERDIPRVTTERTNRNKRLKALGNGIVPRCIPVFLGVVPCIVQETD